MATSGLRIAIDEFKTLTSFDLSNFLIRIENFFQEKQPNIIDWYKGIVDQPDADSFKTLFSLLAESGYVLLLFDSNKERLNMKFYNFELLEQLEMVDTKLTTCLNLSKLLRSTRSRNSYKSKLEVDYTMKKFDTLESVQNKQISNNNFDNRWWDLALRNDLDETQYDVEGGQDLKLPLNFSPASFLSSVVDNPIGDRMYGRDINRTLNFKDDDLDTLDYKATALQSIDIFLETRIGTVPERPTLGYNEDVVVGSNQASISLPILRRQLTNVFNTDDSFTSFAISKMEFQQDALFVEFKINTVRGEVYNKTLKI